MLRKITHEILIFGIAIAIGSGLEHFIKGRINILEYKYGQAVPLFFDYFIPTFIALFFYCTFTLIRQIWLKFNNQICNAFLVSATIYLAIVTYCNIPTYERKSTIEVENTWTDYPPLSALPNLMEPKTNVLDVIFFSFIAIDFLSMGIIGYTLYRIMQVAKKKKRFYNF